MKSNKEIIESFTTYQSSMTIFTALACMDAVRKEITDVIQERIDFLDTHIKNCTSISSKTNATQRCTELIELLNLLK